MTDDEAFLRAIVAAPGDDAPRLVYADWLDERGDPRGVYLRAEVAWAAQWRAGGRRPRDAGLFDLAEDLNPIWLALGGGQMIEFADDRATGAYFIGISPGMMGVIYYSKNRDPAHSLWVDFAFNSIASSLPELLAAVG